MKQNEYYIDIDGAIAKYNEANPEDEISRGTLVKELGVTYQSIFNYQFGKIPNIIAFMIKLSERTGVNIEQLIKIKDKDENKS